MSSSLKIQPHIRGHISSCNGRVDLVDAKAEQCHDNLQNASNVAAEIQAQVQNEREKKKRELAKFQKRVKQRAFEWERTKQLQLVAKTTETMESEQKIAEQAVKLDKIKVQRSVEIGQDVEDIRTIAAARDSVCSTSCQSGAMSKSQLARTNLLARKGTSKTKISSTSSDSLGKKQSVQLAPSVQYVPLDYTDQSESKSSDRDTHDSKLSGCVDCSQSDVKAHKKRVCSKTSKKKFSNPGQMEHVEKKQAALQYLLFRRLYSDLEREQARQNHRQQTHAQRVDILKRHKEASRRLAEEEVNALDSFSVSTEATEDQQRAREWSELMILEERKQELQKARENERFIGALQARLREKLITKQSAIPPLCSCGTSVWDTNPSTCANNCPFYRNPKAYEKALSALLQTLEL